MGNIITIKGTTNNKVGVLPNITMYWPSCIVILNKKIHYIYNISFLDKILILKPKYDH
jgi:hypothetical protein